MVLQYGGLIMTLSLDTRLSRGTGLSYQAGLGANGLVAFISATPDDGILLENGCFLLQENSGFLLQE